jgi:hypothetical protein
VPARKAITIIRYTGDGTNYLEGVPIRDLTLDEWLALSDATRALALATGLYVEE